MSETRKLAAILVTDIVGFSRLAGADEERTLARLRALRGDLIGPAVAAYHGRVVKGTGDGWIIEFRSVVDAARCAIEMQNGLVERNAGVPPERRIEFRVGIHVGDVVEESDGDLMGDAVNIAARLEGIAKPGAICLSEDAYRQVKRRLEMEVVKISDLGAIQLKNMAEPVRAYLVEVGRPDEPLRQRSALRHRLVAALATLSILVVAGAAGWDSIAGRPPTTVSPSTTPTASSFGPTVDIMAATGDQPMAPSHIETPSTTPPASSFGSTVDIMAATGAQPMAPSHTETPSATPTASSLGPTVDIMPATGDQPMAPSHTETQRQVKPALTSQPDAEPMARKVVHSSAKRQPSVADPAQSPSGESASNSSQPCFISAAQLNGNHPSCAYLQGQPLKAEPAQSPPVESASNSSQPCFVSAAQINGNHPSCAHFSGY